MRSHWQDAVNALLGAWTVLSPWALGVQADPALTSNAVLVGLALIAVTMGAMLVPRAWEEWSEALVGLWLMESPWVAGFAGQRQAVLSALITGAAVVALAMWTLPSDPDYRNWLNDEPTPH
ncbi:MAG: SPW repeat protein [Polaromonas sp.]|nr:SPW repeat protein [Polaromonas sp.]